MMLVDPLDFRIFVLRHQIHKSRIAIAVVVVQIMAISTASSSCLGDAKEDKWLVDGRLVDGRLVDGLLERRLFRLAESFCRDRLSVVRSVRDDAAMTVNLIRVLTSKAANAPRHEQEAQWNEVASAANEFSVRHPDHQRSILVQFQAALARLARGEVESEKHGAESGEADRRPATGLLRRAIHDLQEIDKELVHRLQIAGNGRRGDEDEMLSARQLRTVRSHLRFHLARAFVMQSLQFDQGSPDRLHAATVAIKQLDAISPSGLPEESVWNAKTLKVRCLRLKRDFEGTLRESAKLEQQSPPESVIQQLAAERIHLELDRRQLDQAIGLVGSFHARNLPAHEDFELAVLRMSVAAWKQAMASGDEQATKEWRENTTQLVRRGGRRFGRGWSRQADRWLMAVSDELVGDEAITMIQRTADSLFLRGDTESAVDMYDRAVAKALKSEEPQQAFDLGFKAAAILYQGGQFLEASKRFAALASQRKTDPKAAQAQELAALATASLAETEPRHLTAYRQLLESLVASWPAAPQANNAHWWLARLSESQQDFRQAAGHYKKIAPTDTRWAAAVESAQRCDPMWLENEPNSDKRQKQALVAISFYDDVAVHNDSSEARLAASRLRIRILRSQWKRANDDLANILADREKSTEKQQQAASAMMVITAAALGQFPEADGRLKNLNLPTTRDWLDLALGLAEIGRNQQAEVAVSQLGLAALDLLAKQPKTLSQSELRDYDRLEPQLLAQVGRNDDAIAGFEQLLGQRPDDLQIREDYAVLLSRDDDAPRKKQALDQWRQIQSSRPKQSAGWFRARYEIASLHAALGATQRAIEIVELTKTLYPELGGEEMAAQFNELLNHCRVNARKTLP